MKKIYSVILLIFFNNILTSPTNCFAHTTEKNLIFHIMARRMLINGIKIPQCLDIAGKKPWEVQHLDTLELWKFGDYKNYTPLNLLAHVFGIPSPKDDIDGSMVW